ncbi:GNAT family N-acetyltransferase [Alloiococcus sp. CFN-8]|uniref:GNAT family N-acetyltransferase n=1 Tax=Alloiococcus sp. CFN-8 TaxID=3416081 RepID=UPI003CEFE9DB
MKYTFAKNYKDDDTLRTSFNHLAGETFGLNFTDWYNNGFWGDGYIPYSLVDKGEVISNVSVNIMDFSLDGDDKHFIQLGTVMTHKDYRGQGLSRYLMEKVIEEYESKVDGFYLFANDTVLDFYPKFGFVKSKEYQYSKDVVPLGALKTIEDFDMKTKENWTMFLEAVKNSVCNDRFNVKNLGLIAFYTMNSNLVYYLEKESCYAMAEVSKDTLFLQQIIADHKVDLDKVIDAFGPEVKKVLLGFTPINGEGYHLEEVQEENSTLFIRGKGLEVIEKKRLMFPVLSHA